MMKAIDMYESIADHRVDKTELRGDDGVIKSSNGGRRYKETTQGWDILIQWKDGSTTWEKLKDVKQSYPVQLAEYAHEKRLSMEPAFI